MKTALYAKRAFDLADRLARQLGISRSQSFSLL
jgi:hypothetical protein